MFGHERVQQARLGRGELDGLAVDDRLTPMELEDDLRTEDEAPPRHPVTQSAEDAIDPRPQLRVVVRLRDVVLGDLVEDVGLAVAGVDGRQDDDRQVRSTLDLAGEGQARRAAASSCR